MRKAFVRTLTALAKQQPDLMLVTGDLGYNALEEFQNACPKQFLNAGVAEQNMVGVAAGLALSGKRVFVYSIIPFATYRCFEQVRDDLCYHHLPVCMVGVGSGYSYGTLGSTHHALEDVGIMRTLPNLTILCPGDALETEAAVHAAAMLPGPCYLRLGKAGEPAVHTAPPPFQIGQAITVQEGKDITIIASGTMLHAAQTAAQMLNAENITVRLLSMPTLKPLDGHAVRTAAEETRLLVTVEEHGPYGGLGSAVAEILSALPKHAPHLALHAPDAFSPVVGSQDYLKTRAGLVPDVIVQRIKTSLSH